MSGRLKLLNFLNALHAPCGPYQDTQRADAGAAVEAWAIVRQSRGSKMTARVWARETGMPKARAGAVFQAFLPEKPHPL
jgi:hypothetical protein